MKNSIEYLLHRIGDIRKQFGTLTDIKVISKHPDQASFLDVQFLSLEDIQTFKRVVESGTMKNPEYRPPAGHKVLGFLIHLRNLQERQLAIKARKEENGLITRCAEMWQRQLFKCNGDKKRAANIITTLIGGEDELTPEIRTRLNKAYNLAKSWEAKEQTT